MSEAYPLTQSLYESGDLSHDQANPILVALEQGAFDARHLNRARERIMNMEAERDVLKHENAALRQALHAAYSALRSYQHGNSAPDLAEQIADYAGALLFPRGEKAG